MKYALVSYFNTKTTATIRSIQDRITNLTGSKMAHNLWEPHLTVGAGVNVTDEEDKQLNEQLEEIAQATKAFTIQLDGFGFMDDWHKGASEGRLPYVIYIKVKPNPELNHLLVQIKKVTDNYDCYFGTLYDDLENYHTHITVAYGDFDEQGFEKATKALANESFQSSVTIDHFALALQNSEGTWERNNIFDFV